MDFMRKISLFGIIAFIVVIFMAAVPFSKKESKKSFVTIERITNEDSVYFVPYKIQKNDVVDFLKREVTFKITAILPPFSYGDALIIDSIVFKTMASRPLKCTKTWEPKSIEAFYYSPDIYIEGFIKEKEGLSPYYILYIDSKLKKSHIICLRDEKVYTSDLHQQQDSIDIDVIIELFEKHSSNLDKKQEKTTEDKEGIFPPVSIKSNPMYLKDKTSKFVAEAIGNWRLTNVMLINPMGNKGNVIHGCSIVASSDNISNEYSKNFRDLLLNPNSYRQSDVVKNATFLPDYACRFSSNGINIDVLVALYCDDIKVYHNDKEYTLDITPSHNAFATFIKAVFPNDDYIKKY